MLIDILGQRKNTKVEVRKSIRATTCSVKRETCRVNFREKRQFQSKYRDKQHDLLENFTDICVVFHTTLCIIFDKTSKTIRLIP